MMNMPGLLALNVNYSSSVELFQLLRYRFTWLPSGPVCSRLFFSTP